MWFSFSLNVRKNNKDTAAKLYIYFFIISIVITWILENSKNLSQHNQLTKNLQLSVALYSKYFCLCLQNIFCCTLCRDIKHDLWQAVLAFASILIKLLMDQFAIWRVLLHLQEVKGELIKRQCCCNAIVAILSATKSRCEFSPSCFQIIFNQSKSKRSFYRNYF